MALAQDSFPGLVEHISQRVAVGFLGHFLGMRAVGIVIGLLVPGHVQHLFRAGAALLFVKPPQLHHDAAEDGRIMPRLARRLLARVVPLQPAARVHHGPVFLGKAARRQPEDLGHDLLGPDVVELAFVAPEVRSLGHQRVDDHQELQLRQRGRGLVLVRHRRQRVEPLDYIAVDLALVHQVEIGQHVVAAVPFRQQVKGPVVCRRGMFAEQVLLQ
ncbi:hypothetical protein D3C81_1352290 [compost metagenome]